MGGERDRERCRQNQTANATIFLGERERERGVQGGYDVVKKCEPSRRMQTACAE